MSLTKATYSMIDSAPINVDDYIPAGTNTATTDCASFINDALTAGSGKNVVFGQGKTYLANSTITIRGDFTKILGRGATINSYASQRAVTFALVGGTRYPVNVSVEDFSVNAYGVGAFAFEVKTSYATYTRVSVGIPAVNVSGRGICLIGDETNGSGPYYNTFINCDAQSGSSGLDHIGFSFITSAPSFNRAPNANTFVGCRAGSCFRNWVIKGNGNVLVNAISESPFGTGVGFLFEATTPTNCIQNFIYGCYMESPAVGLSFNADAQNNIVWGAFGTGIGTWKSDLGTGNQVLSAIGDWAMPTGISFPSSPIANPEVLDAYEEGTWTPTLVGNTTAGSYTVTSTSAKYTRIGQQVTVTAAMSIVITSAGTGFLKFGGLPFAKGSDEFVTGSVTLENATLSASTRSLAIGSTTSSTESAFIINQSRTATTILPVDCADVSGSFFASVTFTYTALN